MAEGSLFTFPASENPAPDYLLSGGDAAGLAYPFLHGFGWTSGGRRLVSLTSPEGPFDLDRMVGALCSAAAIRLIGVAFVAESRGLWGMNLGRSPIAENHPGPGASIFDERLFADWMDFPIEAEDAGRLVIGRIVHRDEAAPLTSIL